MEQIRKKKEEEAIKRMHPEIDPKSKEIMDKKQGFVLPIFKRAKEIEESKHKKIESMKQRIEEKKHKTEEEELKKCKYYHKNDKHFNKKEFNDWRDKLNEWEQKKKKKIDEQKEKSEKKKLESMSTYHKPKIDRNSEKMVNKLINKSKVIGKETTVFERLYQNNEEIQRKLLQKTLEAMPEFKPNINKKVPSFRNNRPQLTNNSFDYLSEKAISFTATNKKHKHTFSVDNSRTVMMKFTKPLEKVSYQTVSSTVSNSEKTQKSKLMSSSIVETFTNPIIMDNSDEDEPEEDLITKYKKALEQNNEKPSPTPKGSVKPNSLASSLPRTSKGGYEHQQLSNEKPKMSARVEEQVVRLSKVESPNKPRPSHVLQKQSLSDNKRAAKNDYIYESTSNNTSNLKTEISINKAINSKPSNKSNLTSASKYSVDRNKEKIELYNQKIAALLECLKKTEKKK